MTSVMKWSIAILVLMAAAVGIYFLMKPAGNNNNTGDPGTGTGTGTGAGTGSTGVNTDPKNVSVMPLKKGSGLAGGQAMQLVKDVQSGLNSFFGANVTVDGLFGSQTESALRGRGLPVVLYWREYSYISRKPIIVNGESVQINKL